MRRAIAWARGNPLALAAAILAWLMAKGIVDGLLLAAVVWLAIRVGVL